MRQVGVGLQAYLVESRQILPPHVPHPDGQYFQGVPDFGKQSMIEQFPSVLGVLLPYLQYNRQVMVCPSALQYYGSTAFIPTADSDTNYMTNGVVVGQKITRIPHNSDVVLLQEDKFHFNTSFTRPLRTTPTPDAVYLYWHIYFPGPIGHEYGDSHSRGETTFSSTATANAGSTRTCAPATSPSPAARAEPAKGPTPRWRTTA